MPIKRTKNNGFTLLELIVAVGLFTIAIFISFGSLVGMFDANRKSQTIFSALTNLNYAIEGMTRDIRFAKTYHCDISDLSVPITTGSITPRDCSAGGTTLALQTQSGIVVYKLDTALRAMMKSTDGGQNYIRITGSDVSIDHVAFGTIPAFYVAGTRPSTSFTGDTSDGSATQPYVVLVLKGYSGGKPSSRTNFDIQTLISQRQLDI